MVLLHGALLQLQQPSSPELLLLFAWSSGLSFLLKSSLIFEHDELGEFGVQSCHSTSSGSTEDLLARDELFLLESMVVSFNKVFKKNSPRGIKGGGNRFLW